jgi:hypothetical protein
MTDQTPDTVLILRTCNADMTSHRGFRWPQAGAVTAPDWDPSPRCGGGLHGLAWGEGTGALLDWDPDARWLVVEVPADTVVDLSGKVKFPAGTVTYAGDRQGAVDMIQAHPGAVGRAVAGGTATAGYGGTATAGYGGTATAGYGGTATAGDGGTATAGYGGTATAGDRGVLAICWYDSTEGRYRTRVTAVDGETILPDVPYRLTVLGKFEPCPRLPAQEAPR